MLEDPRDAVRTEGLVVLTDLSRASPELQKIFVFEDVFRHIFAMIQADGGLTQGGIVVQDCLSLLATLVRFNTSNQTYFQKMEYQAQFAALLPGGKKQAKPRAASDTNLDDWVSPQSDKNVWGLLVIMRMFLLKGGAATPSNQAAFEKYGLVRQLLNIAFDPATAMMIQVEALNTCADLIRGNARMQETFAQQQVRPMVEPATNGVSSPNRATSVYVIEALLNLVLTPASNDMFDIRNAGAECIKAYFFHHPQIRQHFLNRAIGGHEEGDETANALTILLGGSHASPSNDPYRIWFAAVLVFDLIFDDAQAKYTLMQVNEGDAESGEEVVTCIQTLTANLIASLQLGEDERISIAYLMLLLGWLFEDAAAVDDFLGEASSLQSLVQAALKPGEDQVIIRGMCAALLGIIYEFSTRDSPVPRRDLQPLLTSKLGREKYLNAISELRRDPLVRDFEVLPRHGGTGGNLPDVFFDETFVDFIKDNFSRLSRAIDRDPNIEQHNSHDGVDRDIVDELRGERDEKEKTVQEVKSQLMALEQRLDQEQAEHRKTQQAADEQRNTLKRINDKLHNDLDTEIKKKDREHRQTMLELENKHNLQVAALNNKLQQAAKESTLAISRIKQEYDENLLHSDKARADLERRLEKSEKIAREVIEKARALEQAQQQTQAELATATNALHKAQAQADESEAQLKQLNDEKSALQASILGLESEQQASMDKLKSENEATISKLKSESEATIKKLRTENEANVKELKSDTETKINNLKSENEATISKLKSENDTKISKLTSENDAAVSKLKSEHQAVVDKLKAEIQDLKTKAQDQTWKAKDDEEKRRKAEASTKDAKAKEIKDLQAKLRKAEETEKEKQTELDDMFVILGDLEEKRNRDKVSLRCIPSTWNEVTDMLQKRLKELGEEVSDADDDDDDDEDEDDEDDDEEDE
jgi:hypothetical protein